MGGPDEVTHPDQVPLTNTQGEVVDVALGGAIVSVGVGGASVAVSVATEISFVGVDVFGDDVSLGSGSAGVEVLPGNSQARAASSSMIGVRIFANFFPAVYILHSFRMIRSDVIKDYFTLFYRKGLN